METEFPLDIHHKAFLLHPETPEEGAPRQMRPGEEPGQLAPHLRDMADDVGLTDMRRPDYQSNSLKALQASKYAQEHGVFEAVRDAFYKAYWEDNEDIGRVEVVRRIVEEAGLEWGPLEQALEASTYLDGVLSEHQLAQQLGLNGVPAFVFGNMAFTGAQPMEVFRNVAGQATEALEADPEVYAQQRQLH